MKKSATLLLMACFFAMISLLSLQAYWIVKYYKVTESNFEKEVNLAFEDAIKKEFSLRCDTIEKLIAHKLLDTNSFSITNHLDKNNNLYIINIHNKGNKKDAFDMSFSSSDLNVPYYSGDTVLKHKIAAKVARNMREEDLERHIIFYRTQNLGAFIDVQTNKLQFDTLRLRAVFNKYLAERNIHIPYSFWLLKEDSTTNGNRFNPGLLKKFPVITKSYPTYSRSDKLQYVRAKFRNPLQYILSNLWVILVASILLIGLTAACMVFILKSLFREKRLSAIKNDFISNITHEFKTPIATVSVAIEVLKNKTLRLDANKTERYLNHATAEIQRLNLLVDKVLSLAIYDHKLPDFSKAPIPINETIGNLIGLHQVSETKKINISYENAANVETIYADKTQFQHALHNILDNAVKYSEGDPNIHIQILKEPPYIFCKISDQGIGIPIDQVQMVFEKFYRVRGPQSHLVKGYGLGLNYVKQIMAQHGGWCTIASKLNSGTVITLAWPI